MPKNFEYSQEENRKFLEAIWNGNLDLLDAEKMVKADRVAKRATKSRFEELARYKIGGRYLFACKVFAGDPKAMKSLIDKLFPDKKEFSGDGESPMLLNFAWPKKKKKT